MKFGYRWMVGNGRKIKFWEDIWFGTSPLAVQFWDLYSVVNEKGKTISEIWVDNQIRCSFRRTFSDTLLLRWYELEGIMQHLNMSNEEDALIWQYESNGHYSAKSLYAIINFRDVLPIYIPAIWSITVPSRVHVLWLMSHNKLMTKDNLLKRNIVTR